VCRSARSSALVSAALFVFAVAPVRALDVRIGWRPVANAAGYRVFIRQTGQLFAGFTDVGALQPDGDGVIRYTNRGLPFGVLQFFAVKAYNSSGGESAVSNELSLLVLATPTTSLPGATATRPKSSPTAAVTATRTPTRTATHVTGPTGTRTPTRTALPGISLSGQVRYYSTGAVVPDVTLTSSGLLGTFSATSDADGLFNVGGMSVGIWQLQPRKQGDVGRAVSALDAAYVLQAVSGMRSLDPVEEKICDVTGSGALSALDAARILQITVGEIDRLPAAELCGSDWTFIPVPVGLSAQRLIDPLLSDTACQLGAIVYDPLLGSAVQQDFTAALLGDCTGNWGADAAEAGAALRQTARPAEVYLGELRRRPGGRWLVPLYVDGRDAIDALDAHLGYDPAAAELESVELVGAPPSALVEYRANTSGEIAVALASGDPLTLGDRPVMMLAFCADDEPQVTLLDAVVDEATAVIRD
jgi:hypothetical protein